MFCPRQKALEAGSDISSLKKGLVGGEAFPPSLRDWFTGQGMDIYQSYATADLGLVAYETAAREGLVLDEGVIVEIVRPGTGDPVPEGEVGELHTRPRGNLRVCHACSSRRKSPACRAGYRRWNPG